MAHTALTPSYYSIGHHLLALYGLGASPDDIQKGYDDNAHYQKALYEADSDKAKEPIVDFDQAKDRLGSRRFAQSFSFAYF